jgi:hypothetical protein
MGSSAALRGPGSYLQHCVRLRPLHRNHRVYQGCRTHRQWVPRQDVEIRFVPLLHEFAQLSFELCREVPMRIRLHAHSCTCAPSVMSNYSCLWYWHACLSVRFDAHDVHSATVGNDALKLT